MFKRSGDSGEWGERTSTDLASLLVELGRVQKGCQFYVAGDRARDQLLERAFLAWQIELERAGPLDLRIEERGFLAGSSKMRLGFDRLEELAESLRHRGVERIDFTPDLTRDAFYALIDLMSGDPETLARSGGFATALSARSSAGLVINGERALAAAPAEELAATPASAGGPSASLGSALLASSSRLLIEEEEAAGVRGAEPTPLREPGTPIPPAAPTPSSQPSPPSPAAQAGDPRAQAAPEARRTAAKPTLEESPLTAPVQEERGERLRLRLVELDRCEDDDAYDFLAKRVVEGSAELFEAGLTNDCYRAVLVLADHAIGAGGRSGLQARIASNTCRSLVVGPRLSDVIARACAPETDIAVRATQVLLQLGEPGAVAVFESLMSEQDERRAAQLRAILIALGERTLPLLVRVVAEPASPRVEVAARLAGELQSPTMVPVLIELLGADSPTLRRSAARALAYIADDDAYGALVDALRSPLAGVPEQAADCLARVGRRRAVRPLLGALERALQRNEPERAQVVIRSLGDLGSDRAVPKLVAVLERRSLLRRKPLREIQLGALTALHRLSSREARRAVERSVRHRDATVAERAKRLLADPASTG